MKSRIHSLAILLAVLSLLAACGSSESQDSVDNMHSDVEHVGTGEIQFIANGEDLVVMGFQSKDGWNLEFDHLYVTLEEVTALQTSPPWDPCSGSEPAVVEAVELQDIQTVDLVHSPLILGCVADAREGHYNAVTWKLTPASSGPSEGYSVLLQGTALRYDSESGFDHIYQFSIGFEDSWEYAGGEYVGDERKGILSSGECAEVEMTFHFDHIFGNGDLPENDPLNEIAPGFDMFADFMQEGTIEVDHGFLRNNLNSENLQLLENALRTFGHVGEGHCICETL